MQVLDLRVSDGAAFAASRGHPWVFRDALLESAAALRRLVSGAIVDVRQKDGTFVGRGLWDAESAIAIRIFSRSRGAHDRLDPAWIADRALAAARRREVFLDPSETTAYRLVNGEGDRLPGLVIDRYGEVAVLRSDGAHLTSRWEDLVNALKTRLTEVGIRAGGVRRPGAPAPGEEAVKLTQAWGPPIPETIVVREHGMKMEVSVWRGHKTGAFLDQRENRAFVRGISRGRARVLNLFSYTGGFSIAAALGGAAHVTSVDTAGPAHAAAQRSFLQNGLDLKAHSFVTADVTSYLDRAAQRGERFDLVISDPPSFAPNEKTKERGLAAYRKLHKAVARVLAEGAVWCAASCSSHVTLEDFLSTLDDEAIDAAPGLSVREIRGAGPDHPTIAGWPEGRYLKLVVLA